MLLPLLHVTTALYIPPSACFKCLFSPNQIPCPSTCFCFNLETYSYIHTPWSRVLLEKLASLQLVKKFPAFYGTRIWKFGNPNKTWCPVNIIFLVVLWCNILHRLTKRRGYHDKIIFIHLVLPVPNTSECYNVSSFKALFFTATFLQSPYPHSTY